MRTIISIAGSVAAAILFIMLYVFWVNRADIPATAEIASHRISIEESVLEQLQYNQETLDLSVEFGFNPLIVQVVRNQATLTLADAEIPAKTWRFINTERELTYMFLSIAYAESKGDVNASGDSGRACGMTQIWESTAQEYRPDVTCDELKSVQTHVEIAMEHFVDLLSDYEGNYNLALLAWNRGQNKVNSLIQIGQSPENGYALRVFAAAADRNGSIRYQ